MPENQKYDTLMNFRIPTDQKSKFRKICRIHHVSMSSRLNILINNFIRDEPPLQGKLSSGKMYTKDKPDDLWRDELIRSS